MSEEKLLDLFFWIVTIPLLISVAFLCYDLFIQTVTPKVIPSFFWTVCVPLTILTDFCYFYSKYLEKKKEKKAIIL
jgi:hypothetical protein